MGYVYLIPDNIVDQHFIYRHNSEVDFFSDNFDLLLSKSINVEKGYVNGKKFLKTIDELNPEIIVTYGCSIIRGDILDIYKDRIINIHLGISPYYKGSGTNFHSLVNNEFKYFGYSIIFMNEKIDDGEIIHQRQANFFKYDTPHTIGNRLIKQMTFDTIEILENFKKINRKDFPPIDFKEKIFKRKDSNEKTVSKLYDEFDKNLNSFLTVKKEDKSINLIQQNFVKWKS